MSEVDDEFKNYFNYFTEVEEHFQKARGTSLFLMSPLDWALVEAWKNSGVPLEAVLRGIDAAFDKWRTRKKRTQNVNSVAYCAQAIAEEAKAAAEGRPSAHKAAAAPFTADEVRTFLTANAAALRQAGFGEVADTVDRLAAGEHTNFEELEQRLTALEDKVLATLRSRQTDEDLFQTRRELDASLRPYRGKMSAEQLTMLEKQYLDRHLFERSGLPRLSLFYLQ